MKNRSLEHIAKFVFFLPATLMCTRDTKMCQNSYTRPKSAAGALRTLRKVMEFQINPTDRRRMLAIIDPASNVPDEPALPTRKRQFLPGNQVCLGSCDDSVPSVVTRRIRHTKDQQRVQESQKR